MLEGRGCLSLKKKTAMPRPLLLGGTRGEIVFVLFFKGFDQGG